MIKVTATTLLVLVSFLGWSSDKMATEKMTSKESPTIVTPINTLSFDMYELKTVSYNTFKAVNNTYKVSDKIKEVEVPFTLDANKSKNLYHGQKIKLEISSNSRSANSQFDLKIKSNSNETPIHIESIDHDKKEIIFIADNPSNDPITVQLEVTQSSHTDMLKYNEFSKNIDLRIYPVFTPSFVSQPNLNEANDFASVTYTTQDGMENYTWMLSGNQDIDYTIISGGQNTDNTLTVIWLTTGEKSVKVGYTSNSSFIADELAESTVNVEKLGHVYKVGDHLLGGIIYKVYGTPGRQHGYIVSEKTFVAANWSNNIDFNDASTYSNGLENTEKIVENTSEENAAAIMCKNYKVQTNDRSIEGWYLPAAGQMKEIATAVDLNEEKLYWTSTQCRMARHNALAVNANGQFESVNKATANLQVLPVRNFTIEELTHPNSNATANQSIALLGN